MVILYLKAAEQDVQIDISQKGLCRALHKTITYIEIPKALNFIFLSCEIRDLEGREAKEYSQLNS